MVSITTELPDLATFKEYKATKERDETRKFMLPNIIRNSFLFISSTTSLAIIAACPEPRAGRNEHKGAEIIEARVIFPISFLSIFMSFSFIVFCFGIFFSRNMLVIKEDAPNKPESNGRRGWFMLKFKVAVPKKPARKKIIKEARDFSRISK